jgi:hypothetical protein
VFSTDWRSKVEWLMTLSTSAVAACCSRASFSSRVSRTEELRWRKVVALPRFGAAAFRRRDLTDAEPALERRRIAHPRLRTTPAFQRGLQQRIAISEMVFNDQLALQKILNGPCRFRSWLFSNSGRALAGWGTKAKPSVR